MYTKQQGFSKSIYQNKRIHSEWTRIAIYGSVGEESGEWR